MTLPDDLFTTVEGFISLPEAQLLHDMAASVPDSSAVLEIGAYRGRSTVSLALGAKEVGAIVYSVDFHPSYEAGGTLYSMKDNQAYYANIAHYGLGDVVKTINLPASTVWTSWNDRLAFVFIDGNHDYVNVHRDFVMWGYLTDVILLHDTAGHHEGVTRLLNEVLESGEWERTRIVDSLSVLERIIE